MITYKLLSIDMAGEYLDFLKRLDNDSEYMHFRPGERSMTLQGLVSRLKKMNNQGNSFTVVAVEENIIIGYFSVNGGTSLATCHTATIATGVLENYQGKGIAKKLFKMAEGIAHEREIFRFSCEVVQVNYSAFMFYTAIGFVICGYGTLSYRTRENELVNEWHMEYLLDM